MSLNATDTRPVWKQSLQVQEIATGLVLSVTTPSTWFILFETPSLTGLMFALGSTAGLAWICHRLFIKPHIERAKN